MFSKQRIKMEIVSEFTIDDFTFGDYRNVESSETGWVSLQEEMVILRPAVVLCGDECGARDKYLRDFLDFELSNPGKTTDDFDLVYDPEWDDSQWDPRLGHITLSMSQGGANIGIFNIYNIKTESDTASKRIINAMAGPSFNSDLGRIDPEDIQIVLQGLLEQDVPLEDNKVLDIIEWRFPTRENHRWVVDDIFYKPVQDLIDAGHTIESVLLDGVDVPTSIRRSGA